MRRRGFVRFTPPQRDSSHATTCDIDPEEAALLAALPSDTEAALDLLRQRASATSALSRGSPLPTSLSSLATARVSVATVAPLVLKSQLGSVLADSAEVESALESMRASNTVRLYRLSASPEVVLCRTSDVRALIDVLSSGKPPHNNDATKVSSSGAADLSFLQKFKRVLEECRGMSVTVQSLRSALEQPLSSSSKHEEDFARSRKRTREVSNASSNGCADDDFSSTILMLERIGFLRARQPGNSSEVTEYWFSLPHLGAFTQSLLQGRKELRSMLKRTARKEMLQATLLQRSMKTSHLGMAFHITDLVQRGDALLLATGAGPLVRLRRDTFP